MSDSPVLRTDGAPERGSVVVSQPLDDDTPVAQPDRRTSVVVLTLQLLVAGTVLLQRFVLAVGDAGVGLPLVLVYAAGAVLAVYGVLRLDLLRAVTFAVAVAGAAAVSWLGLYVGSEPKITSFLLLVAMWAPWALCLGAAFLPAYRRVAVFFVRLMVVLALVGIAQIGSQFLGFWSYVEPLALVVPPQFLDQSYNVSNPIFYDSPVHRSQAFVFLEPSFLSQFCALAAVLGLVLRVRSWQVVVLVVGIASSVSGTGVVLLLVGLAVLLARDPRALKPGTVAAGVVSLVVVLLSPAAPLLLDRSGETTQSGSSGYMRFVQPYTESIVGMDAESVRYALGAGAGQAERLLESDRGRVGDAVVYTIVPKLAFEYGLPMMVAFMTFLLMALFRGTPVRVLPATMLVMLLVLSGSLLQPHTVITAWVLTSLWGRE